MLLLSIHTLEELVAGHEDAVADCNPHGTRLDPQEQPGQAPPLDDPGCRAQHGLLLPQVLRCLQLGLDDVEGCRDASGKASSHGAGHCVDEGVFNTLLHACIAWSDQEPAVPWV